MKWISALFMGAIIGFVLPLLLAGKAGPWMSNWTGWGTIRPFESSPGLLFSIPLALGSAIAFRLFFSWHRN